MRRDGFVTTPDAVLIVVCEVLPLFYVACQSPEGAVFKILHRKSGFRRERRLHFAVHKGYALTLEIIQFAHHSGLVGEIRLVLENFYDDGLRCGER